MAASSGRLQEVKNSDQQLPPKVVAMGMGELVMFTVAPSVSFKWQKKKKLMV